MRFDREIPHGLIRSTSLYRTIEVDAGSPLGHDPLVILTRVGVSCDAYYARTDGLNPPYRRRIPGSTPVLRSRREVARRLKRVNSSLKAMGLELLVLDAHRSLECQRGLWKYFRSQATRRLPNASAAQREQYALRYCSDPRHFSATDSTTWPVHLTGGAVDLTLRRLGGAREPVYMGSIFDESSVVSDTDYFERRMKTESDHVARTNRRILFWSMTGQGFTNLASEWWHYDWGTQLWAAVRSSEVAGRRAIPAVYGPIVR